jgi:ABC-type Na+ transport system ATPase subunit NatA
MKAIGIGIGVLFGTVGLMLALAAIFTGADISFARIFDPAREEVRQRTFEHSRAFQEGQAHELQALQLEYVKGDAQQKSMVATMVLHRTANVELNTLPEGLREFVRELRRERGLE